jgi:hypothetical protein
MLNNSGVLQSQSCNDRGYMILLLLSPVNAIVRLHDLEVIIQMGRGCTP